MNDNTGNFPYLHGFSQKEQDRLRDQARILEFLIYQDINFSNIKKLIEVGCGVGAQSEILLRRFPKLHLTGVDLNAKQLTSAETYLSARPELHGRYDLLNMDASDLQFPSGEFDGAFLCWILEHVPEPARILGEVRRVLSSGSKVYITEVMNFSFFIDPYSPHLWKYWMALNDYQYEKAGDPFIGAKLGNLLASAGFINIKTNIKTMHYDNRNPERRIEVIEYWTELLLSASHQLILEKIVSKEIVDGMVKELKLVRKDPNAVFFYSFMQAEAEVDR